MITAKEARIMSDEVSGYERYLEYYQSILDENIKEEARKGRRSYILHIEIKQYTYEVMNALISILVGSGYSVRPFSDGNKCGLWIFW